MIARLKSHRQWQTLLCIVLIIGLVLPFTRALAVAGQVDANNIASAPTIDGNLNEAGWSLANSASKTTIGTPNNTVTFGAMWDATNLYVAVKVLDSNLFNDSANTWEDDSVEVYIDANHNLGTTYDSFDRQFVKGYNDTALTGIGNQTGVQHAWAAVAGGYTTEMAIPWSNLGVSPTSGLTIGFDVGYNDDDNAGTRDSQAVWWGTINNYNNTSAFGKLVLMGGSGPTATQTRTNTPGVPTVTQTLTRTPTGSASLPDLTISSITYVGSTPACANNPRDNVVVSNIGNLNAGTFSVAFNSQTQSVTALAAGQSITLSFGAMPGTSTATADSTNLIAESNESNNSLTASLPAPTQAPTCTPTGGPTATSSRTPTPTITVTSPGGQSPYPSGVPWAIPGTIQAENFDLGGETVAYHDSDAANTGGQYRTSDGVDIEATTDTGGGYNVGWTRTDEWMEYTVNVATTGNYTLLERVASGAATGSFRVEFNSVNKTGTVAVPNTGGWQTYVNLSQTVSLSAGVQVMRIYFTGNDTNLNYVTLGVAAATSTPTVTPTVTRTPTVGPSPTSSGTGVKGRMFVGYQAWFSAVGDGSTFNQWFHWSNGGVPGPGNIKIELYPDTREYTTLFQTNFANLGNGSPARLYSAYTTDTINVHFRWMRENNIDGAALQRFGTDIANPSMKAFRDSVTTKVRAAAEANGRNFYIMYDVTGMSGNWSQQIQDDWTNTMINTLNVTSSPMYAREGSKPVVCIWGMGYSHTPGTASEWTALVNWFKNQNIYVIGGTPRDWRTGTGDSKPGFLAAYTTLNMVSPWTVGAYSTDADVDNYKNNTLIPDRDYTIANGMDYQPVIFAGFAWSNWNGGVRNMIPRRQGNLFWRQVYNLKNSNISTAYVAMFDEYDEGTAIAKAAEDSSMIPTNQYFLTLDADGVHLSADFYLRLAGAANQMLKGQIPLSLTIPIGH